MSDRLCVIVSSSDPDVIRTALQYARRTVTEKFMQETRLFLFGPSEKIVARDPDVQDFIKRFQDTGKEILACKWCSDDYGVTEALKNLGIRVDYIGPHVSEAVRQGYTPMVW